MSVGFSLNLMILGFAYFLKPDVMFGMWVFTLLRNLLAIVIAIGVSAVSTFWMSMSIAYREGSFNVDGSVRYLPEYTWEYVGSRIDENAGPNGLGWLIRLLGGGVMAGLLKALQGTIRTPGTGTPRRSLRRDDVRFQIIDCWAH